MCSAATDLQATTPASIVRVVLDVPLDRQFDYLNPGLLIREGNRVVVPFAGRQLVGIVMALLSETDVPTHKLKAVLQVFDDVPFDAATLKLLRFCADYYHYPFGQTVLASLPLRLRQIKPAVTRKMWLYQLANTIPEDFIGKRQQVLARLVASLQQQGECSEAMLGEYAARLWQGQAVPPLFSSFKPEALAGAMATAPHLPRALLIDALWDGCFDKAQALGCVAIVCNHALWDPALVAQVHGMGMRTLSYTVNDDWAAQRLIALGTDGIITDRVDFFSPATP